MEINYNTPPITEQKIQEFIINSKNNEITKPSLVRLARKAGVKSISDECFNHIRNLINNRITELITAALIVNSEHNQKKTLMTDDIYDGFCLIGQNITQSNDLGTKPCNK